MKVLVCEDNKLTQKVLEATLRKMDYEIALAKDGDEAINLIREDDVDLIITDINMPYNNGLEIVEFVRKRFEYKVPVIIVTNINLDETRKHALELGADAYLTKPFDPGELKNVIESLQIPG